MNMNKIDRNIIFFDVETNGFQGSSVLSMSAIKVNYNSEKSEIEKERWTKLEEFNRFYFRNDGEELNEGAINVNGLTDDVILSERKNIIQCTGIEYPLTFKEDMDNFFLFCQDTNHFVAHNIKFDRSFIDFPLRNQFDTMLSNIDIVKVEGSSQGNYKWPKLMECADFYKIPFEESQLHGSYYDVLIMFRIFFKMMKNQTANSRIWDFLVKE